MKTVYSPDSLPAAIDAARDFALTALPAVAILAAVFVAVAVASATTRARF